MNESHGIDKSNVEVINRWLDQHPGISGREAARQLGIHESYMRRAKAARPKGTMTTLKIADIVRTSATQPRVAICPETVTRYAAAKADGAKFPPPVVFFDGTTHRCGDGFHRIEADLANGLDWVECEVRDGGEREAYLHGLTVNSLNGLPLTTADRKAAVQRLKIDDPDLSVRKLAKMVGIDPKQVQRWLEPLKPVTVDIVHSPGPPDVGQFIEDSEEDQLAYAIDATRSPMVGELPDEWSEPLAVGPFPSLAVNRPELPPMTGDLPEPVAKLTDEEWLAGLSVRAKLSDTCRAVFDRDALIYRQLVTENQDYQRWYATAKKLIDSKTPGLRGHYHAAFQRSVRLKHPGSCLVCGECSGKGCDTCNRRGYQLG